jgi:hypothetical protein
MFSRISYVALFAAFFILISYARSTASVYSWQDADGVVTFTDDLSKAPSDARIKILSADTRPESGSTEPAATPAPKQPSRVPTEGDFVVRLVEELGLSDNPTAEEAADILTEIRVAPQLGRWELDRPMAEELTVRLRKLTVAAAESGRITLTPDEVLLAFDTTAALLGLTIPVTIEPEDASQGPLPLAETPPLVYVAPPPAVIYPYYTWFPVTGGFWWNGSLCSGFFVLNVNSFSNHRGFKGDSGFWDSGRIGRQFRNHIADRHFVKNPGFSNTGRFHRSPTDGGRSSFSNRLPARSHDGMRFSGTRFSRTSPESRHFSQRSTAGSMTRPVTRPVTRPMSGSTSRPTMRSVIRNTSMNNAVRRQPSSYRPVNRMPMSGPSRQTFSGGHVTRPAPSRSFSGGSGRFTASSGQSFSMGNMGGAGIGMNRGGSGFSTGFRSSRGR